MRKILFYVTKQGKSPVHDYLAQLAGETSKDARIKLNKVHDYIQCLAEYGHLALPAKYGKHLSGQIWELRPIRDRILFAAIVESQYVLLHVFMKQTQKTPKKEIEQAERELKDFMERSGFYGSKK